MTRYSEQQQSVPGQVRQQAAHSFLWVALRLVELPFAVLGVAPEQAAVLAHRQRVTHANEAALAKGVKLGMDVTTATALSGCQVQVRNTQLEQHALQALATELYAFTPYIQWHNHPQQPGLLLELSRCLKLFGGSQKISQGIFVVLNKLGYGFNYGFAHTAPGAWLLSYHDYPVHGDETPSLFKQRLKTVELQYLHNHSEAVTALLKTGFGTLGDVAKQVENDGISSIKKRFGAEFAQYFCDVFAIEHNFDQQRLFQTPVQSFEPQTTFNEVLQFDYPIRQIEQLHPAMQLLLEQLEVYLRQRQLECQSVCWQLLDIYGNTEELWVQCDRPQYKSQLLYELSGIKLEHYELSFEVDTLALVCEHTLALQNRDQTLNLDGKKNINPQSLNVTAAKLKAHLGEQAVYKISYCDEHIPERSQKNIAVAERAQQTIPAKQLKAKRPAWLFQQPKPIQERTRGLYWQGYLTLMVGPERIQTQWWDSPVARDYFIARRSDALNVWLYHDLHGGGWYVHGVFA